jgi:hypothetical protein
MTIKVQNHVFRIVKANGNNKLLQKMWLSKVHKIYEESTYYEGNK